MLPLIQKIHCVRSVFKNSVFAFFTFFAIDALGQEIPGRDWSPLPPQGSHYEVVYSEDSDSCNSIAAALNKGRKSNLGLYSDPIFIRWSPVTDVRRPFNRAGLELEYTVVSLFPERGDLAILKYWLDQGGYKSEEAKVFEDVDYFIKNYVGSPRYFLERSEGFDNLWLDPQGPMLLRRYQMGLEDFRPFAKLPKQLTETNPVWILQTSVVRSKSIL